MRDGYDDEVDDDEVDEADAVKKRIKMAEIEKNLD